MFKFINYYSDPETVKKNWLATEQVAAIYEAMRKESILLANSSIFEIIAKEAPKRPQEYGYIPMTLGNGFIGTAFGIQIYENSEIFEAVEEKVVVNRTLKERLFSFPWRPFQITKEIINIVQKPTAYLVKGMGIVAHPEFIRKMKEQIPEIADLFK